MQTCPACGDPITETDQFCGSCGTELQTPAATDEGQPTTAEGATPAEAQELLQDERKSYDFALYYPKERGWKPVIISGLLVLASFLIIPILLLWGYSYRVGRAAATGHPAPPEYGDWGGLAVDGLRFFVLMFIPGLLWLIIVGIISVILPPLGFIAALAMYWFVGAFMTAFMGSGSVREAFTDGQVTNLLSSTYFLKAWLGFILFIIAMWILMVISIFTIVGWLFVFGYLVAAIGAYWGHVHYLAVKEGIVSAPTPYEDG